jgi:hypothetical protein
MGRKFVRGLSVVYPWFVRGLSRVLYVVMGGGFSYVALVVLGHCVVLQVCTLGNRAPSLTLRFAARID